MHVIVTGATSFVGAAAAREFLTRGHVVTAVVRPGSGKLAVLTAGQEKAVSEGKLLVVENDLAEPGWLPEKIGRPGDVFCHFGWGGSGSDARTDPALQERNWKLALGTVLAAKQLGCHTFLFSGSQAEYGLHRTLMTEETDCRPNSAYGEAKLRMRVEGEALCRELGLNYVHARIFSAYGPGDHPWTLVESCVEASLHNRSISLGSCAQQWNFVYIDDLAKAICALAEVPAGVMKKLENPVFNLAGSETKPLREFVEEIRTICGGTGDYRYGERQENAEGVVYLIPSIEKITRMTGWVPATGFADGVREVVKAHTAAAAEAGS